MIHPVRTTVGYWLRRLAQRIDRRYPYPTSTIVRIGQDQVDCAIERYFAPTGPPLKIAWTTDVHRSLPLGDRMTTWREPILLGFGCFIGSLTTGYADTTLGRIALGIAAGAFGMACVVLFDTFRHRRPA